MCAGLRPALGTLAVETLGFVRGGVLAVGPLSLEPVVVLVERPAGVQHSVATERDGGDVRDAEVDAGSGWRCSGSSSRWDASAHRPGRSLTNFSLRWTIRRMLALGVLVSHSMPSTCGAFAYRCFRVAYPPLSCITAATASCWYIDDRFSLVECLLQM